jgi:hypothetical protein
VLKAYSNPVTREGIDELATGGKTQFTDDLVQRIRAGLNREKKTVGKALGDSIDQANEMVNLSKAKAPIKNYSEEIMSSKKVLNPLDKEAADSGRSVFRQVFGDAENVDQEIPDLVSASRAFELQDQLRDFSDLRRVSGGVNPRYANNASAAEKALSDKAAESYRAVGQELDRVTSGAAPELKKQYKELIDIQDTLAPLVRTDQSAYNTFKGMDNPGKVMFKESLEKLAGKTGENYSDDIVKLQAADYFGSGSWTPKSIGGTVSTSRTVPATAIGGVIGGRIGAGFGMPYLGAAIGIGAGGASASPQALKYLIRNTDGVRAIANQAGKGMDKQYVTPVVRETLMRTPWFGVDE